MKMSARTGDIGDPMEVPADCLKNLSRQRKLDDLTQVRSRSCSCSGVRSVLSLRAGSAASLSLAMVVALEMGHW